MKKLDHNLLLSITYYLLKIVVFILEELVKGLNGLETLLPEKFKESIRCTKACHMRAHQAKVRSIDLSSSRYQIHTHSHLRCQATSRTLAFSLPPSLPFPPTPRQRRWSALLELPPMLLNCLLIRPEAMQRTHLSQALLGRIRRTSTPK